MTDLEIKPDESPTTIWRELEAWAVALKPWQRFILMHAVRTGRLTDAQVGDAYAALLSEFDLGPKSNAVNEKRAAITGRPAADAPAHLRLTKIGGLRAVNALPESAVLTFPQNLTVIYGANGVGKSGFARVLSNACFSRSQQPILSNIYDASSGTVLNADVVVVDDDNNETLIKFDGRTEHPELKRIAVFDSQVARTHIADSGPLGFKPAGFDIFPEMARVYGELSRRLADDIARRIRPNNFVNSFVAPETAISKFVASLGAGTDIVQLRAIAIFGETERARLEEVQRQIKELGSKSVTDAVAQLSDAKKEISALKQRLEHALAFVSAEKRAEYQAQMNDYRSKLTLVAEQGEDSFKQPFFAAVGATEWEMFLSTARALAHAEHPDYPRVDDHCLLCHRPLDEPSRTLIRRFWTFLESEARQVAEGAKQTLTSSSHALTALQLNFFSRETKVHAYVMRLNPKLSRQIEETMSAVGRDREHLVETLNSGTGTVGDFKPVHGPEALAPLLEQIDSDIARLQQQNVGDTVKQLEAERVTLRHRQILKQLLLDIESFITDQAWVKAASDAPKRILNPRPLTEKETELFGTIIVKGYRTRFADECAILNCNLPVEVRTKGERGQTVRSLNMKGGHSPDKILSEGEQRAVALADFLTEVHLNPANAGIVLDDPVTSQDHQRKERIARRLVAEAKVRQVIIFTHDLVFVTMLVGAAADENAPIATHWIERDARGNPGQVSLDDCPAATPQYRNTQRAQSTLATAQKEIGSQRFQVIQRGMAELRRTLEEIVPHFLFKQIVNRWNERVMVTKLGEVHWDNALAKEIAKTYEDLSTYIEGHSHTEARGGAPAEPKDLEQMIARVDDLIKRARK